MRAVHEQGYVFGRITGGCESLREDSSYRCEVRMNDAKGDGVGFAFLTVREPDDLRVTHAGIGITG